MSEEVRVRELGFPPMTDREYKIHCKRQSFIKAGDLQGLAEFNAKLLKLEIKNNEKEDS